MDTKRCSKCGEVKPIGEFFKDMRYSGGVTNRCKSCAKVYAKVYRKQNKDVVAKINKRYYDKNREKIAEKAKQCRIMRTEPFREEFFKQLEEDDQVLRKLREENEKKWEQYRIRAV